jgi:hypothetical protein
MSKSGTLRNSDILAVMRHLADVAATRDEPGRQRQLLIDGLNALLGTHVGWWFAMDDWRPDRSPRIVQQVLTSEPDPHWVKYMSDFIVHFPINADPYADRSIHSDDREQFWFFDRVVHDRATRRRYGDALDMMDHCKIRDGAVCALRIGENRDRVVGFSLHRSSTARKLSFRDYAMARLALREIDGLIHRGHLVPRSDNSRTLPPRLRQVLTGLLRGDSPRKIALTLDISIHTVREHIERLYERLDVHSREDLMAKFVR